MIHIVYLIDELKVRGGSEKSLYNLVLAMRDKGLRVSVFCLQQGEYAEYFKNIEKVNYHCLQVKRIYDFSSMKAIRFMRNFIRNEQVDIIQTMHTAADLLGPLVSFGQSTRLKLVSSRRDMGFTKKDKHVRVQKLLNNRVDWILANSSAVKESVREAEGYPTERIQVIHNGIFHEQFQMNDRREAKRKMLASLGLADDCILIGNAGNLHTVKGHIVLLQAMVDLRSTHEKLYCLIAGAGSLLADLQQFCRENNIVDKVFFLGNINEMASFYAGLDVYVQPSLSEGFSNSILEAMAAGCPVVATDAGGNPDVLCNHLNGYLFPVGNSELLAGSITKILANRELAESMSHRNCSIISESYSMDVMAARYASFYQSTVQA